MYVRKHAEARVGAAWVRPNQQSLLVSHAPLCCSAALATRGRVSSVPLLASHASQSTLGSPELCCAGVLRLLGACLGIARHSGVLVQLSCSP